MEKKQAPFFTIFIPTKGRTHYVRFALESLRQQSFQDFEVIVLDSAPTSEVARAWFGGWQSWLDERFKYVRTGDVWMSENFERGLLYARGQYLHVCQDKAVLAQGTLAAVYEWLSKNHCESLVFTLMNHQWDERNHRLQASSEGLSDVQLQPVFGFGSGHAVEPFEVQSQSTLESFLVKGWDPICYESPRAYNCFTRLGCIREIKDRGVSFFDTMSPDLCSSLRLLDHIDGYHMTYAQLGSHHQGSEISFGTKWRYWFGYATDAFAALDPEVLAHMHLMPLGLMPIFHNGIFGDYVNVRRSAYGHVSQSKLRADHYFTKILQDVEALHEEESLKQRLRKVVESCQCNFSSEYI